MDKILQANKHLQIDIHTRRVNTVSSEKETIIPVDILHGSLESPLATSRMGQANSHSFALAYPPTEDLPTSFLPM